MPLFVIGGFMAWATARVLWPTLPMWPFVLTGALIAASEPLWEVTPRVARLIWNIVCNMATWTVVCLVVWAMARVLWPGLSVRPFVLVGVLVIPALLVLFGLLRGLIWMLSPSSVDRRGLRAE